MLTFCLHCRLGQKMHLRHAPSNFCPPLKMLSCNLLHLHWKLKSTWSFERSFNIFDIRHKKCTFEGTNWSFLPEIFFVTVYIATKSKTSWWWSIQIIAISTFTKMIILERKKEKKQQKRRKNPHFSKVSFLNNAPWVCSHTTWYSILSL